MAHFEPFIPSDKPRFFVVFILAALAGFGVGVLAFISDWTGLVHLGNILKVAFAGCWAVAAFCWCGFDLGLVLGRYRDLQPRPWKEQVW
jgi:hypothetical protein